MTMRNKQELIQQVVNLLNAMIESEELPTASPPTTNDQVEMLTIKECAQQISGLSEHTIRQLVLQNKLPHIRTGQVCADTYSYANDYDIITQLKHFADSTGVCLLLAHHTRKQKSEDSFDMISGTNGLLGAADGAFMLHKEKRTANAATLEISGRDQQDQKLHLTRNIETLTWELERAETELWKEPPEPLLEKISELVTNSNSLWSGTAADLIATLNLEMKANILTRKLNINSARLFNEYGIGYSNKHGHSSRIITLWVIEK